MTPENWIFLAAGVFIGALVVALFDGARMWEWHLELKAQEQAILSLSEDLRHAEAQLHPLRWVDNDPQNNVEIKERIYDKHQDLIEPGTTVIRIDGLEEES